MPAPTFRAASSAAVNNISVSPAMPTGTVENDVMFAGVGLRGTRSIATPPTGWTFIRELATGTQTGSLKLRLYRKTAAAGEAGPYTWAQDLAERVSAVIVTVAGADPTAPIDVENGDTGDGTAPSITTTGADRLLIGFFAEVLAAVTISWTADAAMTERADTASQVVSVTAATETFPTAGATGTRTAIPSTADPDSAGWLVAVKAPAGPVALAGTASAAASASGDMSIAGAVGMDGPAPAAASASGELGVVRGIAGIAAAASSASGDLSASVVRNLAGTAAAAATMVEGELSVTGIDNLNWSFARDDQAARVLKPGGREFLGPYLVTVTDTTGAAVDPTVYDIEIGLSLNGEDPTWHPAKWVASDGVYRAHTIHTFGTVDSGAQVDLADGAHKVYARPRAAEWPMRRVDTLYVTGPEAGLILDGGSSGTTFGDEIDGGEA